MSFEDELREVIRESKVERARYTQEGKDFEDRWLRMRESAIHPIFSKAVAIFREESVVQGTEISNTNSSIVLKADLTQGRGYRFSLTFSPNKEAKEVVCSASNLEKESFTLDHLDAAVIQRKIKQFAEAIVKADMPSLGQ